MVRLLVVKTSALGDILHTFPAIQFMREIYPDCQIDWVVEKSGAALVEAHPLIKRAIVVDTKKWRKNVFSSWNEIRSGVKALRQERYDAVFDFQGNIKSGLITGFSKSSLKIGFGRQSAAEKLNCLFSHKRVDPPKGFSIHQDYLALVEAWSGKKASNLLSTLLRLNVQEKQQLSQLMLQKDQQSNILVCPGSNWPNKQLSPDLLLQFLQKVEQLFPCKVWLLQGSPKEAEQAKMLEQKLNKAEVLQKLSLPLLQHWMGEMDHVISMDSLPLHLAAEANVATFSIFGPSAAAKYQPRGKLHVSYQGPCPYGRTFEKRCPILRTCPTGACMHALSLDALFACYRNFILGL